jgi:hypothetical protein
MSDDKKRDRALQRRVRERQAKTGESYQAAWRQLTGSEAPTSNEVDEVDEIDDDDNDEALSFSAERLIIPLHQPRVAPRKPTRVAARATNGAVDVESLYISGAGTPGGAADWIVNDVEIDGRSQLTQKDLPGSLFGGGSKVSAGFHSFDPVERDHELVVVVAYVGQNPEGVPFYASIMGTKPAQRPTVVPIVSKKPLPLLTKTTIQARVRNAAFQLESLTIQDGDTAGGAADWIVNGLRIDGRSQFVQSGDIPGDMFSTNAIDAFVKLEPCKAGTAIEIDVTYIGLNEPGAIFAARLEGTVLRDDYGAPPPDLHIVIETSDQGPGEVVIATCNWRAPATDNRTR